MNNNALISASVLNAYWSQKRRDTLDLLMPFLKFSINETNQVGCIINVGMTAEYFKKEFGYENIPLNVVYVMLNRLSPKFVQKENKKYKWVESFDREIADYKRKRTDAKEKREKIIGALKDHLSSSLPSKDYAPEKTMDLLYSFFVENGLYVSKDVTELGGIRLRDGKINYEIARFITNEYHKQSAVFDYIVEMVNGFFVSTATAMSIQNVNSTDYMSKCKDMSCYIDTRIIINALGLHLEEARKSATEFLDILKNLGIKMFCFSHNFNEICDVLNAYRNCLKNPRKSATDNTLEGFDERGYTPDDVERYIRGLNRTIEKLGVKIVDAPSYYEVSTAATFIDETGLKDYLLKNMHYNAKSMYSAVDTDVASVSAIMRLRNGNQPSILEKSKYIFVSTNNRFVNLVAKFLNQPSNTVPCVIGDMDLAAILWLKSYKVHKDYPKNKLIENAMMALEPSPQFISAMFDQLEKLKFEGNLTLDEVAIMRTDLYTKRQAMKLSQGDCSNIDVNMIQTLRDSIRTRYIGEEMKVSENNYQMYLEERNKRSESRKKAYEQIDAAGEQVYNKVEKRLKIMFGAGFLIAFIGFVACVIDSLSTGSLKSIIMSSVLGIINAYTVLDFTFSKWNNIKKWIFRMATHAADKEKDKKRDEYEPLIGSDT